MAFLSFKWLLPVVASVFHPFYVSVTEITHNAKEQELEISCKLITEDIEAVLRKSAKNVDLSVEAQHAQNDKLIEAYMQQHIALSVDGKAQKMHYLGFETAREAVYCYFEVTGIATAPRKLEVQNALLYDFTDKESNFIHVTINGKRQSTKLDYPNKAASFSFQ